jgi:uncharacterized membrane protein
LCEGLCYFLEQEIPSCYRYDEEHRLRIIANTIDFKHIVAAAFDQIRQNAGESVVVRIRLLKAIAEIAKHTQSKEHYATLRQHAKMIYQDSLQVISEESDRLDIEAAYLTAMKELQ